MKKLFYVILISLISLAFIGCSTDDTLINSEEADALVPEKKLSETEAAILKCIKKNHVQSRSTAPEMIPYYVDGEVVFYVVNYDEGWEIYSNDIHFPMLIMKSETGNFYPGTLSDDEAPFMFVLRQAASTIHDVIEGKIETSNEPDETWIPFLESAEPIADMEWQKFNIDGPTDITINEYEPLDGRLNTCWNQSDYFNSFTKHIYNNETSRYEKAMVGCVAVAVGQYLYWYHNHFSIPESYPESANLNFDSKKNEYYYNFTGENYDWDLIFSNDSPVDYLFEPQTSLFLGEIAYRLNTNFGLIESSAKTDSAVNVINHKLDNSNIHTLKDGNFGTLSYWLSKGYPMVAFCSTKDIHNKIGSHAFILDYCKSEAHVYHQFWVYKEVIEGDDTEEEPFYETDTVTFEQLVEYYGRDNVREKRYYYSYNWVKMNWGWYGKDNECMIHHGYLMSQYVRVNNDYYVKGLEVITPASY